MIDKLQSHYGFTRTPFGRSLAPGMLHRHGAHAEAVARIGWCITERALGVITGEVGADTDSHSPFAGLLVGQPTLRRRIKLGTFAALDQRITLRYAMNGMTTQETGSYINHHQKLAGRSDTLFSDDALALIHQVSHGLPPAVNNLAIQALVAAYASNKAIVDESSARAAIAEPTAE